LADGTPVALELLQAGSCWRLTAPLDLTSHQQGPGLATQAAAGRALMVLELLQSGRFSMSVVASVSCVSLMETRWFTTKSAANR